MTLPNVLIAIKHTIKIVQIVVKLVLWAHVTKIFRVNIYIIE